jgi:asparagine synthase (glutamine-hydrolysing)
MEPAAAASLLGAERARTARAELLRRYRRAPVELMPASISGSVPAPPHASEPMQAPSSLADVLLADLAIGLPADMLHKVDLASMHHGLEVRVPLLSTDVIALATALPLDYRIRGGSGDRRAGAGNRRGEPAGKRILRDAFRDLLPPEILARPKMGFEVPVGEFLRRELRDLYHDTVTPAALDSFGLDPAAAARLYAEHAARRADRADLLWALLVLCRWRRGTG